MGSITLSCGHEKPHDLPLEATAVMYRSEDCDPLQGYHRVIVHATRCLPCQAEAWFVEDRIHTDAEGEAWLDGGRVQGSDVG
jgi:hypothetical protein